MCPRDAWLRVLFILLYDNYMRTISMLFYLFTFGHNGRVITKADIRAEHYNNTK